ncbi:WXG100-like domain-containing protein [Saccharopolyspora phatthalungensis]
MVPEEVRRLFQVLTGEDMTDADEDALFAVAAALESGAATVEALGPVVGDVVELVRGGFSGKAADRFTRRLEAFGPVLESGAVGVRQLAEFVRNLALQVQYLKFVTVGGLLLLVAEIAWAVAMAGPTGGASMAWLAARFAVMRLLLTRWWGQLFMRLAMAQIVGIGLQVVMDAGAQGLQFALGTRKKWDAAMSEMAVGVGSFSGLLAVPLSALGNVVGNAITKVLVRGLGDKIDAEVLAAAARQVAEEHAEQYPVASMARFADVVAKNLEDYTGMSVRAMWVARFGHGLGESLEEGLTEMLGEAGYGAISGQGAQWNPFSFTAGVSEAIGSGIGNLAGLAVRGQLIPAGRARDTGEKDSTRTDTDTDTDTDTAEESTTETGIPTSEKPGFAETVSEKPSPPKDMPDVQSHAPAADSEKMDPEKGSVTPGIPVASTLLAIGSAPAKTPPDDSSGATGAGDGTVAGENAGAAGALSSQDRPDPPPYSPPQGEDHARGDAPATGDATGRASTPPPPYRPAADTGHTGPVSSDVDITSGSTGHAQPSLPGPAAGSLNQHGPQASDVESTVGESPADSPTREDHTTSGSSLVDSSVRGGSTNSDGGVTAGGWRVDAPPAHGQVAGGDHAHADSPDAGTSGVSAQRPAPLPGSASPVSDGSVLSEGAVPSADVPAPSPPHDDHPDTGLSVVDTPGAAVEGAREAEPAAGEPGSPVDTPLPRSPDAPSVLSGGVVPETTSAVGMGAATEGGVPLPGLVSARGDGTVAGLSAGTGSVAGSTDAAHSATPQPRIPPQSPGGRDAAAGPVGLPADTVRVPVRADVVSEGSGAEFVRRQVGDAGTGPVVLAPADGSGSGVVIPPNQAADMARSLGRDVVALVPGRGRRGPRWMRFGADGARPRPTGGPGPIVAPGQTSQGHQGPGALTGSATTVPTSAAQTMLPESTEPVRAAQTVPNTRRGEPSTGTASAAKAGGTSAVTASSASASRWPDVVAIGHGTRDAVRPARADAVSTAAVSLPVRGTGERADYVGWTRSPHHAAAPQDVRPLLVVGHNDMVVSGDFVALAHGTGADVLARVNLGAGPWWQLYRADGSRPRLVDPPAELTHRPRPEPLLFRGPRDSSELIERAAWLAPHLLDTQIVAVHVTGDGRAVLGDGSFLAPEGFAARVQQDRRFVPGLNLALLGCAAYQRPGPGALSFAERFTRALGGRAWATDAEVFQTADGGVHATETVITGDGRMLPMFVDGQGTGLWSLLDPDGQPVLTRGPELRAALTGTAPPRYTDTRPEPVIRWADNGDAGPARPRPQLEETVEERARAEARRAREAGRPHTGTTLGAIFGRGRMWGAARLAELRNQAAADQPGPQEQPQPGPSALQPTEARQAGEASEPDTATALAARSGSDHGWGAARFAETTDELERHRAAIRAETRRVHESDEPITAAVEARFRGTVPWSAAETLGERFGPDAARSLEPLGEVRQLLDELLRGWWAANEHADGESSAGRRLADEDVRRLADAVGLRYRDRAGEPGTRSAERLRGRLLHVLDLTQELGGQPTVDDARDVRLVADWIRDTGRLHGPTVTAADIHTLVQELTETTTNARPHEVRHLAGVLQQAEQRLEQLGQQRRATLTELQAQWRRGATQAVTLRMGSHTDNTVAYPISRASSRWWRDFRGGRVDLAQIRHHLGITSDQEPLIVVVEARRRTAGAEKSFLLNDEIRNATTHLDTPWDLGQRVASTEQYQRIAATNQHGPVVLVVLGGNAGLGVHLSRDQLTHGFAQGLSAGGDNARQVLLAEGYITHDPAGLGLAAAGPGRHQAGLVLPSGVRPSVLTLRLESTQDNAVAYPINAATKEQLLAAAERASAQLADDSRIAVMAWITPRDKFTVADEETRETQDLTPRDFARRAIEDARSHGITGHDDDRTVIVHTFAREPEQTLQERARQDLAASFREAGHRGPVHVARWNTATNSITYEPVVPWSPRLRLAIPVGSNTIDAVAYPLNSTEEALWRQWAESGPNLDGLLAEVRDETPTLVLAFRHPDGNFAYVDPGSWRSQRLSARQFGRVVAGALRDVIASDPSKPVVVFAVQQHDEVAVGEHARQELARGIQRYGHEGPVYVAAVKEHSDGDDIRFDAQGIALAGGRPRPAELSVRELTFRLLAAGGTAADVAWWSQWSSKGFRVSGSGPATSRNTAFVLARLWGDEFVTPSGTVSAFEFGRQMTLSGPYQDSVAAHSDAPVVLATVGAETGLSEHAAREFARGVWSNDPNRAVHVTDRDFRLRRDANGVAIFLFLANPPRFVPPQGWSPVAELIRPADDDFGPVVTYSTRSIRTQLFDWDTEWFVSAAGHRRPFVVVAKPEARRFHVLDPATKQEWVLGPSDFGRSVARSAEFQQGLSSDPDRPVVVLFGNWPSGLTERDARSLAEGLRSDGIARPVFLSMGEVTTHPDTWRWRPHALIEAPSVQSAQLTHPASAVEALRPSLVSCLGSAHAGVPDQLRSFGIPRLLSELGYSGPQPPIVLLTSRQGEDFILPDERRRIPPGPFGSVLAKSPKYLDAMGEDWRRPVVIVTVGGTRHQRDAMTGLHPLTQGLLGTTDADRPVYITEDNIVPSRLASPAGGSVVSGGLRLLTTDQKQPLPPQQKLQSHNLRIGVGAESAHNAVCFPAHPGDADEWRTWGSLDYAGHGPMLRRAVAEFDPDPLFVCVRAFDGKVLATPNGSDQPGAPDPVELGTLILSSPDFQLADTGQLGRTVVVVPIWGSTPLPDWYARALAEGLRQVGGPPRPVYVYDGYSHSASDTDAVLDRLRNVTPELHWRRAGDVRDPEESREFVPHYEPDSPPSYESAGEAASAVAAVDRQREAALSGATRPALPAEITEAAIATVRQRWSEEFQEAERALSALPANWLADLQARATTILASMWPRPRQSDTPSAMAMQDLWDRMAQRIAYRLSADAPETSAWAEAAAMVAPVLSLQIVQPVRGPEESPGSPDESEGSPRHGASREGTAEPVSGRDEELPDPGAEPESEPSDGPPSGSGLTHEGTSGPSTAAGSALDAVAEFAELTGRMRRHLATLPPNFGPEVRPKVELTRRLLAERQNWTPAQLDGVRAGLPGSRRVEQSVRNVRRRMVRHVYDRAQQSIALGRDPIVFFHNGVPGGVSSRPDVRLGFEIEFQLLHGDFGTQLESLGTYLDDEGFLDWDDAPSSLLTADEAKRVVAEGKWALIKEVLENEVEVTSPILRAGAWPDVARLLEAARLHGGDARDSAGNVNVSFDWPLTPAHYVRLAQLVKAFEALLYRLGNVQGSAAGGPHRNIKMAGPMPLPVTLDTADQDGESADDYGPAHDLNSNKHDAVLFELTELNGLERTEFRLWAGSLNPAVWQARAELSAAMALAVTDPTIYPELERRMVEPDLLGHEDPGLDEDARLEQLLDFLALLPLSPAAQTQVVQLFATTQPWRDTGGNDPEYRAQTVDLPGNSKLFPAPGNSKASVVAATHSYQLYEDACLILAKLTSNQNAIRLWDGRALDFDRFAWMLGQRGVGMFHDNWTVLAIRGGVPPALVSKVLESGRSRVLVPAEEMSRTRDGRLVTGRTYVDQHGVLKFQPSARGWIEFAHGSTDGRPTGKADLGEALAEAYKARWPNDGHQSRTIQHWPVREPGARP